MSEPNLYEVLGLERTASSHQIRAAFRKLVKRFHPDLFPTAAEKTRATAKLREINEAYAVLGNPKRRREYDQRFIEGQRSQTSARPGRNPRSSARPNPRAAAPNRQAFRARGPARSWRLRWPPTPLASHWKRISKKHLLYALGSLGAVLLVIYSTRGQPRLKTAWVLVEKVELSSPTDPVLPPQRSEPWSPLAEFKVAGECSAALKAIVRDEESQGARAVFDERNAMAIIVQLRSRPGNRLGPESPQADSEPKAGNVPSGDAADRASGPDAADAIIKRVRNLECRPTRRLEMESPIERALRSIGR